VGFAFFAGILLHRLRQRNMFQKLPSISGLWLAGALLLAFLLRPAGSAYLYDLACVGLLFPCIVALGISASLPAKMLPVCRWLGRLSYPVYLLHWPIIDRNAMVIFGNHEGVPLDIRAVISLAVVLGVASVALLCYDEPLRRWLRTSQARPAAPAMEVSDAAAEAGGSV
jgi:peptidoglycan/LPS O-acetylase OafA/YrhL